MNETHEAAGRGSSSRGRGRGRGGRGGRGYRMSAAKSERARAAKETINVTIPHILEHTPRARAGITATRKYTLAEVPMQSKESSTYIPSISVVASDTFNAAADIIQRIHTSTTDTNSNNGGGAARIAVLNMASTSTPGGGILSGAQAQEETLCRRSTLYPSLTQRHYHPLDAGMVVYSPDVLVFMDSGYQMLPSTERFYVDVISAAALRRPELRKTSTTTLSDGTVLEGKGKEGKGKDGGDVKWEYASQSDYEAMMTAIRSIMRVAAMRGVTHLVLGAFGCGAYGNPNHVVADIFRRVICGRRFAVTAEGEGMEGVSEGVVSDAWSREEREVWSGIREVVFAVLPDGKAKGKGNFEVFADVFADVVGWQESASASSAAEAADASIENAVAEGETAT
ncbi:hypothetical protein ABW21_db0208668 [Orbilia brochopaga]|nr:hypothetical protein ABW21_db0208668 [Drechslerella brochopaga]